MAQSQARRAVDELAKEILIDSVLKKGTVERAMWRLRSLLTQPDGRGDPRLRALVATCLLFLGEKEEAVQHLTAAFNLRNSTSFSDRINLLVDLTSAGEEKMARVVVDELLDRADPSDFGHIDQDVTLFALRYGDLPLLRRVAELIGSEGFAHSTIQILEASGLQDLLADHQHIVESTLGPSTVRVGAIPSIEDGSPSIVMKYWTTLNGRERLKMLRTVHEAIGSKSPRLLEFVGVFDMIISGLPVTEGAE